MKLAVLLSGGVDSSTALWRLKNAGHNDITAFYLKVWLEDELEYLGNCPWEEDLSYARAVCEGAGVQLEVVSLQVEYFERVVQYALAELREGRTPSPDIFCNQRIKFGAFFDRVGPQFEKIATGHYAVLEEREGAFSLHRAPDPVKDQSYFLSHLNQSQLSRLLFPIGDLQKAEVRALAHTLALPNMDRPDSQGICFLGKIRYPEFIRHYLGEREGPIVELETGTVLGKHRGYWFHTIGQRQGLGLGNGPWYVVKKEVAANVVYVSHAAQADDRARSTFTIGRLNWLGAPPERTEELLLKVRHGPELNRCSVVPLGADNEPLDPPARIADAQALRITMEKPDRGIAPGQFGVLYDGDLCLGGGMIE